MDPSACFHLLLGESQVTGFVCSYLKYTDDIFVFNPVIRQNYLRDQVKCVFKREEGRVVHFSPNAAPSSCPTYNRWRSGSECAFPALPLWTFHIPLVAFQAGSVTAEPGRLLLCHTASWFLLPPDDKPPNEKQL